MQIDAKGMYGKELHLGVQTNSGNVQAEAIKKAKAWAPKKAKSFTIIKIRHENYHGDLEAEETGYATITVAYYTTKEEGKNLLTS